MEEMLGTQDGEGLKRDFIAKLREYTAMVTSLPDIEGEIPNQEEFIRKLLNLQNDLLWMSDRLRIEMGIPVV